MTNPIITQSELDLMVDMFERDDRSAVYMPYTGRGKLARSHICVIY